MDDLKGLEETLLKAKIELMMRSVYISAVCLSLKHRFTDLVPTAGTNGIEVLYNPDFFASLSFEEQIFVVAHETWHPALDHFNRRGAREARKWNFAGDHVINLRLKDEGYAVPKDALCDPQFKGMATEEVYRLLPDPPEDYGGFIGVDMQDPPPDADPNEYKAKMHENIIKAKLQSEMAGKAAGEIPGEVQRVIDELLNPVIPWQQLLHMFMQEFVKEDHTWSRPNRRFQPDFYLPSQHSPSLKTVSVAVDTSGSISQKEFDEIFTEVQAIKDVFNPSKMEMVLCDCRIGSIIDMEHIDHVSQVKLTGGGGTDIRPVMEHYKDNPPNCLIYFTDLHFGIPAEVPTFPILWICTGNHKPMPSEWGKTIYMHPHGK